MNLKTLLLGVLAIGTLTAHATRFETDGHPNTNPELEELRTIYQNEYDVLKTFFTNTNSSATISDFDSGTVISKQKCVLSFNDNVITEVAIRQIIRIHPPKGPLFPERRESKIAVTAAKNLVNGIFPTTIYKLFDVYQVSETNLGLLSKVAYPDLKKANPFRLYLRKNGDLIPFAYTYYEGSAGTNILYGKTAYGYCWREN